MKWDVAIIGAGLSGLAAAMRLSHFQKKVVVLERHTVWGGLNSFYKKGGHHFDSGLHAMTNWIPQGYRGPRTPLQRVMRQLRLRREDLDLVPQSFSEIAFDGGRLRFENGLGVLTSEVERLFPGEIDGFRRLCDACAPYPQGVELRAAVSARARLRDYIQDPALVDMLLCPLCYYGSPRPNDLDWDAFVILFNSIFREGFCRPREGMRPFLRLLRQRLESGGGVLLRGNGVQKIDVGAGRVQRLILDDGGVVEADTIISSAGRVETERLRSDRGPAASEARLGRMAFCEVIFVLDRPAAELGFEPCITFFNQGPAFSFEPPGSLVDPRSGVICCPSNYTIPGPNQVRVTLLANDHQWFDLDSEAYARAKAEMVEKAAEIATRYGGPFRHAVVFTDAFTPTTVKRFTGHERGLIYGSPDKVPDGRTDIDNLFLCGTDQGLLGIVGSMLSGALVANRYALTE